LNAVTPMKSSKIDPRKRANRSPVRTSPRDNTTGISNGVIQTPKSKPQRRVRIEPKDRNFFDMSSNIIVKAEKRMQLLEKSYKSNIVSAGNAPWKMVADGKKGLRPFAKVKAFKSDLNLDEVGLRKSASFNQDSLESEPDGTPRTGVCHKFGGVWNSQDPYVREDGRNKGQSNGQALSGLPLKTEVSTKRTRKYANSYRAKYQDHLEPQTRSQYLSQVLPDLYGKNSKQGTPDPKKSMVSQLSRDNLDEI
jgi:hypothetical protein